MATKKKAAPAKRKAPAAAKKPAPSVEIDPKVLAAAKKYLPAIKAGEISLRSVWKDRLKLDTIATLRRALTELCGGNARYLKMLEARSKHRAAKKSSVT